MSEFAPRQVLSLIRKLSHGVLPVALAALLSATPLAAKPMKAPGSRVAIELPHRYEVSKLFSGFILRAARISIVLFELPATAYEDLAKGLTQAGLATKGIKNVKSGKLERTDKHVYLTGVQDHASGPITKHILLIRNATHAALITANVPKASIDGGLVRKDHVIKALATAAIETSAAPSDDPFKLGYLGRFKEAGQLRASAKLYTEDGNVIPPKKGAVRNALIVAPSINQLPVPDVKAYARRAWSGLRGYDDLSIGDEKKMTAGGLEGYRITGQATRKTPDGSVPVFLTQVFLKRTGGGYFRIVLIGRQSDQANLKPEFDKIVGSFKAIR